MPHDDTLERLAAKLDFIAETLEAIKDAAADGRASSTKLDHVLAEVKRAADAIDRALDPA